MNKLVFLGVLAFGAAMPANATSVLTDNFDSEAGGGSVLNYAGYTNFDVLDGTVDQIHSGYAGISCVGGAGGCVDLDGSTRNGGTMRTKSSFGFNAGDIVTLSFDLSGNQRGGSDEFSFGFLFDSPVDALNAFVGEAIGPGLVSVGDFLATSTLTSGVASLPSGAPYTHYSIRFTGGAAGSLKAYVATSSADNVGPILDNFMIDVSAPAVPEPASWAMMIAGFSLAGTALRRRRAAIAFA